MIEIELSSPLAPELALLHERHTVAMHADTPPESIHMLPADALAAPGIRFYVMREDGAPLRPLGAHCPVTAAEVLYAVREEMALTLGDVLLRRTEAGSRGHPGDDAVEAALRVLAGELGWSDARQSQERQNLRRVYETTTLAGN